MEWNPRTPAEVAAARKLRKRKGPIVRDVRKALGNESDETLAAVAAAVLPGFKDMEDKAKLFDVMMKNASAANSNKRDRASNQGR